MVLHVHTDASYLSEPKAQIILGVHNVLSSISEYPVKQPKNPMNNGPLHTKFQVLSRVIKSAVEAKPGVFLHNGKTTIPLCTTIEELGHQQHPTPINT